MKDFRENYHGVAICGICTMKEFVAKYTEIANSVDKVPTASTMNPVYNVDGGTRYEKMDCMEPLYEPVIFFESKTAPSNDAPAAPLPPPKKEYVM